LNNDISPTEIPSIASTNGSSPDDGRSGTTVVVGAARGIGAAIAACLAAAEWTERIVLADLDDAVDGTSDAATEHKFACLAGGRREKSGQR